MDRHSLSLFCYCLPLLSPVGTLILSHPHAASLPLSNTILAAHRFESPLDMAGPTKHRSLLLHCAGAYSSIDLRMTLLEPFVVVHLPDRSPLFLGTLTPRTTRSRGIVPCKQEHKPHGIPPSTIRRLSSGSPFDVIVLGDMVCSSAALSFLTRPPFICRLLSPLLLAFYHIGTRFRYSHFLANLHKIAIVGFFTERSRPLYGINHHLDHLQPQHGLEETNRLRPA